MQQGCAAASTAGTPARCISPILTLIGMINDEKYVCAGGQSEIGTLHTS